MAISVNKVYKTVLLILNKEQRGYMTPEEFNRIGTQVQREIFEKYFEDKKIKLDIILDMIGGSYLKKNLKILKFKGRLTYIAALESIKSEINLLYIMTKQLKISGSTLRSRTPEEKGKIVKQVLKNIWPLIEEGKYKPTIYQTFKMIIPQKTILK